MKEAKTGEREWREHEVRENAKDANGPSGEGREEKRQGSSEE